ncbi:hypothetical protein SprV_0301262800 [Sparganum proliferum]
MDLTKAFGTVNRDGLWKIMQKFDCPKRLFLMVRQLPDGVLARVTENGAVSEAFTVTNGVKQGCVLAPTLFSLMFSVMLMDPHRLLNGRPPPQTPEDALPVAARTAPNVVSPSTSPSPTTPSTNVDRPPQPPIPSSSSSTTASTSVAVASAMSINTTQNPDTPTNPNSTTVNTINEDLVYDCPHCDRTFTSRIGVIDHLRIHRPETGETVPGAPTYTRRIRLHCPHCTSTFSHRMGPLGHMRVHENLQ